MASLGPGLARASFVFSDSAGGAGFGSLADDS